MDAKEKKENDICRSCARCCRNGGSSWMRYLQEDLQEMDRRISSARIRPATKSKERAARMRAALRLVIGATGAARILLDADSGAGDKCQMLYKGKDGKHGCHLHGYKSGSKNLKPTICRDYRCANLKEGKAGKG